LRRPPPHHMSPGENAPPEMGGKKKKRSPQEIKKMGVLKHKDGGVKKSVMETSGKGKKKTLGGSDPGGKTSFRPGMLSRAAVHFHAGLSGAGLKPHPARMVFEGQEAEGEVTS